jgi:hypothetical protein
VTGKATWSWMVAAAQGWQGLELAGDACTACRCGGHVPPSANPRFAGDDRHRRGKAKQPASPGSSPPSPGHRTRRLPFPCKRGTAWFGGCWGSLPPGSKFLSIVRQTQMVSSGDNEVYTSSGLRGVISYVQCVAVVFLSQVCDRVKV